MSCIECGSQELEFIDFYGLPMLDDQIFILGRILMCDVCGIPLYYDEESKKLSQNIPAVLLGEEYEQE